MTESSGSKPERLYDSAETLEEFQSKVQAFAQRALAEIEARQVIGETGFTIDYLLDRSQVMHGDAAGGRIPLSWFQNIFYDYVAPAVDTLPRVLPYADFYTMTLGEEDASQGIHVEELMRYALIVDDDMDRPTGDNFNPYR